MNELGRPQGGPRRAGAPVTDSRLTLPLLPLTSGVVLPGMVFTLALESDDAQSGHGRPRRQRRDLAHRALHRGALRVRRVVAEVTERGRLPGGVPAIVVRGDQRALIGTGVPGTGAALWVEAEPVTEPPADDEAQALAREYRAVLENILLGTGGPSCSPAP